MKKALLIISGILALDQVIKLWVKLNFAYGESHPVIEGWFDLQFVENPGMAFGWMIPGQAGKLTLSIFRILVAIGIGIYLRRIIRNKMNPGYITCISLIMAGALGNIFDSLFYGLIFDKGCLLNPHYNDYGPYFGMAQLSGDGYAPFLMGNVVDMFHFSKEVHFPEWFPLWGGQVKEIFPPVFNLADTSITVGIVSILIWQKRYFDKPEPTPSDEPDSQESIENAIPEIENGEKPEA